MSEPEPTPSYATLLALLADFVDPDPCELDHHGYCQAHGWTDTEPRCPHARAKELLAQQPARTEGENEA